MKNLFIILFLAIALLSSKISLAQNTDRNFGKTPNGLYKKIEAMKNSGNPNAKVSKANAPTSTICD
ncbi:hypothetical protein J7E50_01325 [Pedobacter sp. ISL-68]|uniref:hypothetical protein n=1 Tax=unclassified Pedobacter TaxID=2628915 RepID=UPI001BE628F5|nr:MULTISPECIES: hypothetical protein [unclassified Pedobacter]MBT2563403.1 hypothetical protein [Pedobacter sp. ISL-64]MBT2588842.1 hypothetical protein [Pedobacter sp. ISL-68]